MVKTKVSKLLKNERERDGGRKREEEKMGKYKLKYEKTRRELRKI